VGCVGAGEINHGPWTIILEGFELLKFCKLLHLRLNCMFGPLCLFSVLSWSLMF